MWRATIPQILRSEHTTEHYSTLSHTRICGEFGFQGRCARRECGRIKAVANHSSRNPYWISPTEYGPAQPSIARNQPRLFPPCQSGRSCESRPSNIAAHHGKVAWALGVERELHRLCVAVADLAEIRAVFALSIGLPRISQGNHALKPSVHVCAGHEEAKTAQTKIVWDHRFETEAISHPP